jgi:crotonobetaine/carnitine-CoA ligase
MDTSSFASEQAMRRLEREVLPCNLGALLSEAAARHPDRPLAEFFDDGVTVTYGELERDSNRLASSLAAAGVGSGTHVAVMLPTGPFYPVTWFALAKLGAVTVPVNPAYTPRELAFVIADSDSEFAVIHDDFLPVLEQAQLRSLPKENVFVAGGSHRGYASWNDLLLRGDASFPAWSGPTLDHAANIQYTSGTTGVPKGAIISHGGWVLRGRMWRNMVHYDIARNLVAQPFHYVDGQALLLLAICSGATAYVAARQSASRFVQWLVDFRIEFCSLPEVVARTIDESIRPRLALKVAYGYSYRKGTYSETEARIGCPIRQMYGMTETGCSLYVPVEAEGLMDTGAAGIPSAMREVRIVDDDGRVAPPGVPGEIRVRGRYLFAGYYNRPEANAAARDAEGWFRTGDIGVRDEAGWFHYLGRRKDMVKRSGESVSALEVEQVLRGVPGVLEAAVLPVPDDKRGEEVKAYLRLQPGCTAADVPPEAVLAHCEQHLARFKVPRYLEYVEDFPRTPSEKIRKSALIDAKADLREGSFDAVQGAWHRDTSDRPNQE